MPKEAISYEAFLEAVDLPYREYVDDIHRLLTGGGCTLKLEAAKMGYVASYVHPKGKKTMLNFVFRKSGLLARVYADNVAQYLPLVEGFPDSMRAAVKKAPACKRMLDITACNSRCAMGYDFEAWGERHQKCRYNGFLLPLNDESAPFIRGLAEGELGARAFSRR